MNRYYEHWNDYLNDKTVTYPEPQTDSPEKAGRAETDRAAGGNSTDTERRSGKRRRATNYDSAKGYSASPVMDAILKPISLAGFLEQMAQIAYHMKVSGGGDGGGRSRKRKRKGDEDKDD